MVTIHTALVMTPAGPRLTLLIRWADGWDLSAVGALLSAPEPHLVAAA